MGATGWAPMALCGHHCWERGVRRRTSVVYIGLSKSDYLALQEHWIKKPKAVWPFPRAKGEGCLLERHWAEALVCRGSSVPAASLPCLWCTDLSNKHQEFSLEVRANPQPPVVPLQKMWILPAALHTFPCVAGVFYCRWGLHSRERMGFYYFSNKISEAGDVCVCLHNVHMKSCRHVLWFQHLLCAFADLRNECIYLCAAAGEMCRSSPASSEKGQLYVHYTAGFSQKIT